MNFTFKKNGATIDTLQKWQELGHPKSDKHWKPGRSAMEMAKYAIEHTCDFENLIRSVLKECGILEQDFECEPEATISLGPGMKQGGSRSHDLLMVGKDKDCVICIEAKVSEPFDATLENKMKQQASKKGGNTKETRAYQLLNYLVPSENQEKAKGIGYQLFTATRGTIWSALENSSKKTVMLVVVFTGEVQKEPTYEKNCRKNDEDFDAFLKVVNADENGKIVKEIEKKEIECWIKKVKIHISSSYTKL